MFLCDEDLLFFDDDYPGATGYIDTIQAHQRASPYESPQSNTHNVDVKRETADDFEHTTLLAQVSAVSNAMDLSYPTRLRASSSENMCTEKVYINPRKRALLGATAVEKVPQSPPVKKRKSRPVGTASRRAREQELILQRKAFVLFIDDQRVELCGHRDGIFAHHLEPRMCGFSEAVRDRIKPTASYLQGPCELFKTYDLKYRLGRLYDNFTESPDDLICYYSYDHDTTFSLDCRHTNSFGPRGPPHKYMYIMQKSATNIFNYLIIRRDVEPCITFMTPPCREYVEVIKGVSKNMTVKICHLISKK